jgi:putative peptidoglycan lipid II flippase
MNAKTIFSGAFILFVGNLLSSLLGLTREVLSAAYYGANIQMDAYIFAYTVPSIFLSFVSGILMVGFIPLYIKKRVTDKEEASLFLSNILNLLMLILVLVIVLCFCFSGYIAGFFAINASSKITIEMLFWILLPSIFFFGLSYALQSVLNALHHFTVPAFLTALNNICVILFIFVLHRYIGIYSVALGFMIGTALQVGIQLPMLKKLGVTYSFYIKFKDEDLKKMLMLSVPIIGLVLIDQCGYLATRVFSSQLDAGSVSALNYATRIMLLPVTLFGTALITATYPSAVLMQAENRNDEFNLIINTSLKSLLLILMPVMFICIIFAPNFIKLLFERGAFDSRATQITATLFMILSLGIVAIPIKEFINKLFFSKEIIKTPIISSIIYFTAFFISCIVLVPYFKYIGIAVASTSALLVSLIYQIIKYNALDGDNKLHVESKYIFKIVFSSTISTGFSYLLFFLCMHIEALQKLWMMLTLGFMGLSLVFYLMIIKGLKIKEVDYVYTKLLFKYNFTKRSGRISNEG